MKKETFHLVIRFLVGLALSLLKDINTHMLKQSWQWAVNGRLLDMHAEFFGEIAVVGDEYGGSGSEEEE